VVAFATREKGYTSKSASRLIARVRAVQTHDFTDADGATVLGDLVGFETSVRRSRKDPMNAHIDVCLSVVGAGHHLTNLVRYVYIIGSFRSRDIGKRVARPAEAGGEDFATRRR